MARKKRERLCRGERLVGAARMSSSPAATATYALAMDIRSTVRIEQVIDKQHEWGNPQTLCFGTLLIALPYCVRSGFEAPTDHSAQIC